MCVCAVCVCACVCASLWVRLCVCSVDGRATQRAIAEDSDDDEFETFVLSESFADGALGGGGRWQMS